MEICVTQPHHCDPIDVRCINKPTESTDMRKARIIKQKDEDIGLFLLSTRGNLFGTLLDSVHGTRETGHNQYRP
jgi:hypothetical protein